MIHAPVWSLKSVDSTNNFAANLLKSSETLPFTAILAYEQTRGRGQRQSEWHSPPNAGIYTSILVPATGVQLRHHYLIAACAALAVRSLLITLGIGRPQIKWPNDLFVSGKKVSGILCEATRGLGNRKWVIVGIGINTVKNGLTSEVGATSLEAEGIRLLTPETAVRVLRQHLAYWLQLAGHPNEGELLIRNLYNRSLVEYGCDIHFRYISSDGWQKAEIVGINASGLLEIRLSDKSIQAVRPKQIEHRYLRAEQPAD